MGVFKSVSSECNIVLFHIFIFFTFLPLLYSTSSSSAPPLILDVVGLDVVGLDVVSVDIAEDMDCGIDWIIDAIELGGDGLGKAGLGGDGLGKAGVSGTIEIDAFVLGGWVGNDTGDAKVFGGANGIVGDWVGETVNVETEGNEIGSWSWISWSNIELDLGIAFFITAE